MRFEQKVILGDINILDVISSFHDRNFIQYLIIAQPVRIVLWDGITDNKKATFSFWFFGWRTMKVIHKNYSISGSHLSFEDQGIKLPFGLLNWNHTHIIKSYGEGSIIIDKVRLDGSTLLKKYFVYPIMIFPIILRRLTYRLWFYFLKREIKPSFKHNN